MKIRIMILVIGTVFALAGLFIDRGISCSEETTSQTMYLFGNACQDRLFGAQVFLMVMGLYAVIHAITLRSD